MSSFSLYAHALLTLICILQALEKKKKKNYLGSWSICLSVLFVSLRSIVLNTFHDGILKDCFKQVPAAGGELINTPSSSIRTRTTSCIHARYTLLITFCLQNGPNSPWLG